MASTRNKAGTTFVRAMKRIDRLHKEIDRRARGGRQNEEIFKIKLAPNGARVWSF